MHPSGKFTVFVSSTSEDLGGVRAEVVECLNGKGFNGTSLESENRAAGRVRELIEACLQSADAVVILVGFSKGTDRLIAETWTQYEFRRTGELGIPVFVYFLEPTFLGSLGINPSDAEVLSQAKFRKRIEKSGLLCNRVSSLGQLKEQIERADYPADAARWQAGAARRWKRWTRALVCVAVVMFVTMMLAFYIPPRSAGPTRSEKDDVPRTAEPKAIPVPTQPPDQLHQRDLVPIDPEHDLPRTPPPYVQRNKVQLLNRKRLIVPKEWGMNSDDILTDCFELFGPRSQSPLFASGRFYVCLEDLPKRLRGYDRLCIIDNIQNDEELHSIKDELKNLEKLNKRASKYELLPPPLSDDDSYFQLADPTK